MSEDRDPQDSLAEAVRLAARGETAASLGLLAAATFSDDLEPAARFLQSELLERLDRWGDAWTVLERALARSPDHPGLALRAGVSSLHRGDLAAARTWLRRAWTRGALPEAAYRLGELGRMEGRGDESRWWALTAAAEGADGEWRRRAEARLLEGGRP